MVKCRIWAIAVLIAFMTVMSAGTVAAATFTDVEGTDCEEAVTVLYSLGLVEGRTEDIFAPSVNMTRAELATVIMRFMNMETETSAGTVFSDVDSSHWASGNIGAAYGMGIINGMGDGTFAPDANVTYAQTIKMFVSALGYSVHAEATGGYPSGYMSKAAQLGILKGVSVTGADTFITRSDMAIIMYNMLEIDLLVETSFGAGASGGYEEAENKTLLSEYHGIYVEEGVVTANYYTAIETSESNISKGEVAIDGVRFTAGETDAEALLGYKVKAYYEIPDASETPALLYIAPVSGTETIALSAADVSEDTTETSIEYTDAEGKEKTFAVDSDATLVLNGVVKAEWTKEDLKPALGTVTAVNNRGSEDIIFVDAYTNYIVSSKNISSDTVNFKEGASLVLDLKDTSKRIYFVNANGEEIGLDALTEWDVLSVAIGGNVIKAIKSDAKVSGKVAEVDAEDVVIGETKYTIDPNLPNGSLVAPELNMTASFCLDFMGNIAAVDTESATTYKYGYLVGAMYQKGIGGIAQFKVFTEDGQMVFFDAADKVVVNGISYAADAVLENIPQKTVWGAPRDPDPDDRDESQYSGKKLYEAAGTTIRQLVRYTTNDDNTKIKEIETATDVTATDKDNNPLDYAGNAGFNMVVELAANGAKMTPTVVTDGVIEQKVSENSTSFWNGQYAYRAGGMASFAGKYIITSKTKVFVIPEEGAPDEDYEMKTKFALHDVYPGAIFYDLSEGYGLGAIVWDKDAVAKMGAGGSADKKDITYPTTDQKAPWGMFLGTSKAINEDGDPVIKVRLLKPEKEEISVVVPENFAFGAWIANTDLSQDEVLNTRNTQVKIRATVNKFDPPQAITVTPDPKVTAHDLVYLEAEELKYGDVIQYTLDMTGTEFETGSVVLRASTPGMFECSPMGCEWNSLYEDIWYAGSDLVSTGTIKTVTSSTLVLETAFVNTDGTKGNSVVRAMTREASLPLVVAIDIDDKSYEVISFDEVMEGEKYSMVWTTTFPNFFIVYR